jgi:hypothetical protein
MLEIITIISLLSTVCLAGYVVHTSAERERDRFREFVKSVIATTPEEYAQTIDEGGELPEEVNEFVDLDNVDEQVLIRKLQEDYNVER